jgi:hypothetical protein
MPTTKTTKSDTTKPEGEQLTEMEQREDGRREHEGGVQQDLNQGMDTGTHDNTRRGINWGPSYSGKKTAPANSSKQKSAVAPKSAIRRGSK